MSNFITLANGEIHRKDQILGLRPFYPNPNTAPRKPAPRLQVVTQKAKAHLDFQSVEELDAHVKEIMAQLESKEPTPAPVQESVNPRSFSELDKFDHAPKEPTNLERALRVKSLLGEYGGEEGITDLLTDIRHFCCLEKISYTRAQWQAAKHFNAEKNDDQSE